MTNEQKKTWGGTRRGAGRPALNETRKAVTIRLNLTAIAVLRRTCEVRKISMNEAIQEAILTCYKK